jgi:hypothetical protein
MLYEYFDADGKKRRYLCFEVVGIKLLEVRRSAEH